MSDFLDQFSKDKYSKDSKKEKKSVKQPVNKELQKKETVEKKVSISEVEAVSSQDKVIQEEVAEAKETIVDSPKTPITKEETKDTKKNSTKKTKAKETNMDEVIVEEESITTTIEPDHIEVKRTLKEIREEELDDDVSHEVEVDNSFQKKKRQKQLIIGGVAIGAVIISVILYFVFAYVSMPNLVDKKMMDANIWAKENGMTITYEEEFSLTKESGVIISQEPSEGSRVKKGSGVKLIVSAGADPDEQISMPDFKTMDLSSIKTWIEENQMNGITIVEEYSTTIEKNEFISIDIKNKDVSLENFKRKDKAIIYVSKGEETFEANIVVPNFINKPQAEVDTWITENKFTNTFTFEEGYSDTVEPGNIISQSVSADSKISKVDTITFVVSKGKAVIVPDYSGTNLNSFDSIQANGIMVEKVEWYSTGVSYGYFLEQSVSAGTNISDSPETIVKVYYSAGRPYLDNVIGKSEGELQAFFFDFNAKGANITYTVNYDKPVGCEAKGTVIRANKYSQYINMTDHIYLTVSNGNIPASCGEVETE